jgi:uncharacterized membrane protein (Fun14 family)
MNLHTSKSGKIDMYDIKRSIRALFIWISPTLILLLTQLQQTGVANIDMNVFYTLAISFCIDILERFLKNN